MLLPCGEARHGTTTATATAPATPLCFTCSLLMAGSQTWTLEANEEGQGLTEEAVVGPSSSGGPAVAAAVAAALSCLESQPGTAATGLLLAAATGRVEGDSAVGAPAAEAPDEATCTEAATSSSEEMKAAAMEVMDAEAVAHKHLVVRGGGSSTGEQSTEVRPKGGLVQGDGGR